MAQLCCFGDGGGGAGIDGGCGDGVWKSFKTCAAHPNIAL